MFILQNQNTVLGFFSSRRNRQSLNYNYSQSSQIFNSDISIWAVIWSVNYTSRKAHGLNQTKALFLLSQPHTFR